MMGEKNTWVSVARYLQALGAYNKGEFATALHSLQPLAKLGDSFAQNTLGNMFWRGHGVTQDKAEAERWYRLAAEQGYAHAQINIGSMYHFGKGVPKDGIEALRWYHLAAKQGYAQAQYLIGHIYVTGVGVQKNCILAHMWYTISGSNGCATGEWLIELEEDMSQDEYAKARQMAKVCMASNDQDRDCD